MIKLRPRSDFSSVAREDASLLIRALESHMDSVASSHDLVNSPECVPELMHAARLICSIHRGMEEPSTAREGGASARFGNLTAEETFWIISGIEAVHQSVIARDDPPAQRISGMLLSLLHELEESLQTTAEGEPVCKTTAPSK